MTDADISRFKKWAEANGGVVEPATNPYELARIRHADGVLVLYKGKRGLSFSDSVARSAWAAFRGKKGMPLGKRQRRSKAETTVIRLVERDGDFCWFCGCGWTKDTQPTIEHLLSICHGGSNNIANLVLACQPCNVRAGNLPISQKVLLKKIPASRPST